MSVCLEGVSRACCAFYPSVFSSSVLSIQSGLKVLVDLRDVLHDALPVRSVGLHQLLHVLFGAEKEFVSYVWEFWYS